MKGIADFTRGPVTKQLICFALPLFNQACYIFDLDGFLFFLFPVIIFLSFCTFLSAMYSDN